MVAILRLVADMVADMVADIHLLPIHRYTAAYSFCFDSCLTIASAILWASSHRSACGRYEEGSLGKNEAQKVFNFLFVQ